MCRARGGTGRSRSKILLVLHSVLSGLSVEGMDRKERGREGRGVTGRGREKGWQGREKRVSKCNLSLAGQPEGLWNKNHSIRSSQLNSCDPLGELMMLSFVLICSLNK